MNIHRATGLTAAILGAVMMISGCNSDSGEADSAPQSGSASAGAKLGESGRGEEVFLQYCASCHRDDGAGIGRIYPPLAESEFLKDRDRTIQAVVNGLEGPITVGEREFNGTMPPLPPQFDDQAAADVINYVVTRFGGGTWQTTAEEVAEIRD